MIKLLVGLGNPGPEYEDTRHNAGFWWLDDIARDLKLTFAPDKNFLALVARGQHQGQPLWLLKPQTFMNRSGQSVGALARFFKIAPDEILVAHDELDLPPGQARLKLGGSHAGHNGLRDIHAHLGSDAYWRLRIGIGIRVTRRRCRTGCCASPWPSSAAPSTAPATAPVMPCPCCWLGR